jgi:hypothetical protein
MKVFTLLLLFSTALYAQSPWQESQREVLEFRVPEGFKKLQLQLIVDEESDWAHVALLQKTLEKSSRILARCQVGISHALVRKVRFSAEVLQALNTQDPYKGPSEVLLMGPDLEASRPVGFLMDLKRPSTASAFNRTSIRLLSTTLPQVNVLAESFHMTSDYRTNQRFPGALVGYDTFTHELVHLLGDLGHVSVRRNLMSSLEGRGAKGPGLTPEQCAAILSSPHLN